MPFCFPSSAKRRSTFGLLALVGGAATLAGEPARAQYYPYPPTVYGAPAEMPRVYRAPPGYVTGTVMLPPQEIRSIVLNLGYGRVGRPVLRGRTYMIDAVDDRGPLILAVDAYSGLVQPADPSMFGPPGGPYGPGPAYGVAPPPGAYDAPPQGAYGGAPPQGAYGAPPQRAQPVARAPLPKPRPADSEIASTSGPDITAPAVPPADDGAADNGVANNGAADDDAPDTAENPGALAVAPSDGANAPKAATPGLASPTPSMSAPVVGQPAPAQAPAASKPQTAANTPIPALPAVPPQGPTGAGTATPGDGVSAGTASVLSRTAPPAN